MVEDKVELIYLFPKFKCTDKFGRKWLLFLPEDLNLLPTDATLTQAFPDILSIPPLGLEQVEEGKIWSSPNHQIAYIDSTIPTSPSNNSRSGSCS